MTGSCGNRLGRVGSALIPRGRRVAARERRCRILLLFGRGIAGILLTLAAMGKAAALAKGIMPVMFGFAAPWWTVAVVVFETFLAAWLVAGWRQKACCALAAVTFSVFAAAGLVAALRGQERCGCFGQMQMPIAIMVPLNLALAGTLAAGMSACGTAASESSLAGGGLSHAPTVLGAVPVAAVALAAAWIFVSNSRQGSIILTPELLLERPAVFLAHVQNAGELARGRWVLLVYRSGCGRCESALELVACAAEQERRRARQVQDYVDIRYAVLLLPGSSLPPAHADGLQAFRANAALTWYAVTPMLVELRDGVVQRADIDVKAALERCTPPTTGCRSTARHAVDSSRFPAAGAFVRQGNAPRAQHQGV